ncbi:M48 family metalloprotease [Reinekea sp. G2M2-21]|uniref:M48 family metalloprotease n=1 Tax=Reinekea sp. G2M2-21 TaxID=2788942 RepID=UPI0018AC4B6F|nr:M48 family metalloprotease [Reinekea sp. G2M2-21]
MSDTWRIFFLVVMSMLTFQCASVPLEEDFRARWSQTLLTDNESANTEAEIKFGREVAARMLADIDGVENFEIQKYVNTLGNYLAQYSARPDLQFYFWVIESDAINAYAMPGGYIFITSAAYRLLENEAELAGVLAHEIAHVKQKHIVHALDIKAVGAGATLTQLTSGASDAFRVAMNQASEQAVALLKKDGLHQEDEYEADEIGLTIMVQAGYEPDAYLRFLQRVAMVSARQLEEVTQTHPSFASRLTALEAVKRDYGMNNLNYAQLPERFNQFKLE